MADDKQEFRADGWVTFAGGMRHSDGARYAVGDDQAEIIVNGSVRKGRLDPRPAFRKTVVYWNSSKAQTVFERGVIQASRYYDSPIGARWVYIVDGYILSFDPLTHLCRIVSPNSRQCFHSKARHCFLEQRGRWMICQDGISPPVILDGENATVNADPYNGIPTGMMMADGWHRLIVVAPDRKRIYISDHEFDPISTPLSFTDDATYYKNARYFEIPRALGRIVGVTFAPSFNNSDDWGPLLVFCEHGTRAYQLQVPRENWLDQDISATLLPTVGACAHGSFVARGNDVMFSDQNGRIQTFKQAITTRDDVRLRPADQFVWPLYRGEDSRYRRWRKAARFDDRILFTIRPEPVSIGNNRLAVRHRGFVVMEEDHLSENPFVWAGLWTGIYPVSIDSGGVKEGPDDESPVERCFAVSLDPDRVNRIYEIEKEPGPDMMPGPRRVSTWVIPKWQDFDRIFDRKDLKSGSVQISQIRGRVSIEGWWESAGDAPRKWLRHEEAAPDALFLGVGSDCGIALPFIPSKPRLNLPAPESDGFYRARPWLRITGTASLEEGIFEAVINRAKKQSNVVCVAPEKGIGKARDCEPNFWEGHSLEKPVEETLEITLCGN